MAGGCQVSLSAAEKGSAGGTCARCGLWRRPMARNGARRRLAGLRSRSESDIARTPGSEEYRSANPQLRGSTRGKLDFVTINHVIEHVHDPLKLLREIRRLLRPRGELFIDTRTSMQMGTNSMAAIGSPWTLRDTSSYSTAKACSTSSSKRASNTFDTGHGPPRSPKPLFRAGALRPGSTHCLKIRQIPCLPHRAFCSAYVSRFHGAMPNF